MAEPKKTSPKAKTTAKPKTTSKPKASVKAKATTAKKATKSTTIKSAKMVMKTKPAPKAKAKPPVKKVAVNKETPKKVSSTPSRIEPSPVLPGGSGLIGWLLAVLFGGALVGLFVADSFWMSTFDKESSMVVVENKTWMPVEGTPVTVVVLNDETCGSACDASRSLDSLRASVTPALKVKNIDISSNKGKALVKSLDLVSVPQYFFEEDIEDLEVEGPEGEEVRFIDNLPAGLLTMKDDLYYIDSARVGFKPGKFIKAPEFADLDTEPVRGTGPIKVVEFTNYQCGYCKRFHDQNKTLIDQLVSDGSITYMVKDFPMFGRNDRFAHQAANCALKQSGQDVYWQMNRSILANQADWSNSTNPESYFVDLASEQGVDIAACMADAGVRAEIDADMEEGRRFGVTGTPSVFVGTQILPGAVGPAALSAAVNAELNQ